MRERETMCERNSLSVKWDEEGGRHGGEYIFRAVPPSPPGLPPLPPMSTPPCLESQGRHLIPLFISY